MGCNARLPAAQAGPDLLGPVCIAGQDGHLP
jgi:hypothetical protein